MMDTTEHVHGKGEATDLRYERPREFVQGALIDAEQESVVQVPVDNCDISDVKHRSSCQSMDRPGRARVHNMTDGHHSGRRTLWHGEGGP